MFIDSAALLFSIVGALLRVDSISDSGTFLLIDVLTVGGVAICCCCGFIEMVAVLFTGIEMAVNLASGIDSGKGIAVLVTGPKLDCSFA